MTPLGTEIKFCSHIKRCSKIPTPFPTKFRSYIWCLMIDLVSACLYDTTYLCLPQTPQPLPHTLCVIYLPTYPFLPQIITTSSLNVFLPIPYSFPFSLSNIYSLDFLIQSSSSLNPFLGLLQSLAELPTTFIP